MKKKVFIIGNGFDLNLGWRTSYKDFVKSEYWPLYDKKPYCPMAEYLNLKVEIERWYDLESILREYAAADPDIRRKAHPKDVIFYDELRSALAQYLKQEIKMPIDRDSLAIRVLRAVIDNGYFTSIYTFNYTNLYDVAKQVSIHSKFSFEYVHGCLERNTLIIGVDDHTELKEGYEFLRKVFSKYYTSHPIRYDLQECDEVVIFGHSLGGMDYPYFFDFFNAQSHCQSRAEGKRITIFTKDDRSRYQILKQLRLMNEGQTEHLQNDNDFKLIMTEDPDDMLLNKFFSHLSKDCKRPSHLGIDPMIY